MQSAKVVLTGSFGVGKTSLFTRFIEGTFSEKYLTTIGVKVDKKIVEVENGQVNLMIWDIAGEVQQTKVPRTYFLGTSALIYVFDGTREPTYKNLDKDIAYLNEILPGCPVWIVLNKIDLLTPEKLAEVVANVPMEIDIKTSAKTGENVTELFENIAKGILQKDETLSN